MAPCKRAEHVKRWTLLALNGRHLGYQWRAVGRGPGPSVRSYTVPPELIHLLLLSL